MKLITNIPLRICSKTWNDKALFDSLGVATTYSYNLLVVPPQTIVAGEQQLLSFMDSLEDATCRRFQIAACRVFADSSGVCLSFSGIISPRDEKRDFYKSL